MVEPSTQRVARVACAISVKIKIIKSLGYSQKKVMRKREKGSVLKNISKGKINSSK